MGNISAVEGTKVILGYEFAYNTQLHATFYNFETEWRA